jgi:hypothetical protein
MKKLSLFTIMLIVVSCGQSKSLVKGPKSSDKSSEDQKEISSACSKDKDHEVFHTGIGDIDSPFIICNANELQAVKNYPDKVFRLGNNIDLSSIPNFMPIGGCGGDYDCVNRDDEPFTGSFDGDGYKISNLKINIDEPDTDVRGVGFFGRVDSSALITNVQLDKADIDVKTDQRIFNSGALVGILQYSKLIDVKVTNSDIYLRADLGQVMSVGLISGNNYYSDITAGNADQNSRINIFSPNIQSVGGLVGYFGYGVVDRSFSKASLVVDASGKKLYGATGDTNPTMIRSTGGLIGNFNSSFVFNSFASSLTLDFLRTENTNQMQLGGLIGRSYNGNIAHNFVDNIDFNFTQNAGTPSDDPNLRSAASFLGSEEYGNVDYNFVVNSPILAADSNYYSAGYQTGSFLGNGYYSYLYYNYTTGDTGKLGYLYGGSGSIANGIVAADVKGNSSHAVFGGWDFNLIWGVEANQLPVQVNTFGTKAERNPAGLSSYANSSTDQMIVLTQKFIDDLQDFADNGTTSSELITNLIIYSGWSPADLKTRLNETVNLKTSTLHKKFSANPNFVEDHMFNDIELREALILTTKLSNPITPLSYLKTMHKLYPGKVISGTVSNCDGTLSGNQSKSLLGLFTAIPKCLHLK